MDYLGGREIHSWKFVIATNPWYKMIFAWPGYWVCERNEALFSLVSLNIVGFVFGALGLSWFGFDGYLQGIGCIVSSERRPMFIED